VTVGKQAVRGPSEISPGKVAARQGFVFYPTIPPISLELTNRCNLKCPYCANNTLTRPDGFIRWELLESLVDQCAGGRNALDWLHGTGEPLLWDRLEEVIKLITSRKAGKASFATNATLLHPGRVESLLKAGLKSLYISLDSMKPEIYKSTRGGDVDKVIENIRTMISIVPADFGVTIALMNHKTQEITETDIALFRETFGPEERVKLNLVENGVMPSARDDYRRYPAKFDTCSNPKEFFFIALDGRAALCGSDQDLIHVIGNTNVETIDEIWFKRENQITFRNIALGVGSCPKVCTEHCHLKAPSISRSLRWAITRPVALIIGDDAPLARPHTS
jgi:pyruvate-formate lyase-activating enzyme